MRNYQRTGLQISPLCYHPLRAEGDLLLLQLVVGGAASSQAGLVIAASHGTVNLPVMSAFLVLMAGVALMTGTMTPVASVLFTLNGLLLALDATNLAGYLPPRWMP